MGGIEGYTHTHTHTRTHTHTHAYVRRILPQRAPFLLVDRVLELKPQEIKAVKNVTATEPVLTGHFPEEPIFPGVLLLEGLAQTAGLLLAQEGLRLGERMGYLASVARARFRRPVRPGDQLVYEVRMLQARKGFYRFAGRALVGPEVAAEAQFTLVLPEVQRCSSSSSNPNPDPNSSPSTRG